MEDCGASYGPCGHQGGDYDRPNSSCTAPFSSFRARSSPGTPPGGRIVQNHSSGGASVSRRTGSACAGAALGPQSRMLPHRLIITNAQKWKTHGNSAKGVKVITSLGTDDLRPLTDGFTRSFDGARAPLMCRVCAYSAWHSDLNSTGDAMWPFPAQGPHRQVFVCGVAEEDWRNAGEGDPEEGVDGRPGPTAEGPVKLDRL